MSIREDDSTQLKTAKYKLGFCDQKTDIEYEISQSLVCKSSFARFKNATKKFCPTSLIDFTLTLTTVSVSLVDISLYRDWSLSVN